MKKILPLAAPLIRCYANHAHTFAILGANSEKHFPWIFNYYVQLYIPYDLKEFKADYLIPGLYYHTPNLLVSRIDRRAVFGEKEKIIEIIKHYIDNDYYIYTLFEVNKIAAYSSEHFERHDPLIYGYDDEKREFYFADTYIHGKYGNGIASYDEILMAAGTENEWKEWGIADRFMDVLCMKYRESHNSFIFNKEMYADLLEDYIEQRDSFNIRWRIKGIVNSNQNREMHGVGVYSYLQDYLESKKGNELGLDRRGFYVIWEHKIIMERTMNYLFGNQWKEQYSSESQTLRRVIDVAAIMLNVCLKYNITREEKLIDEIKQYAVEIEENERVLIPRLIRIIKDMPI